MFDSVSFNELDGKDEDSGKMPKFQNSYRALKIDHRNKATSQFSFVSVEIKVGKSHEVIKKCQHFYSDIGSVREEQLLWSKF